ncbi:tetraacyldisaccharide 4'-kinase [Fulvivirga lutimaris]|uniref:tetraacyldisaccharide 4'-kinase n=1 Tax=Fulvivirga lutimaris TaxID=1819566 RepID=UPI0012BBE66E|nr:tetraacyldisaccharide 4'-kinase [Fulvivirga lutimaris]MTI40515.1 tetraacyldisaccharide 4'-kinase [Fulvivirga lutimaris]
MGFLGALLFPFTIIYSSVTKFRNYLFDIGFKRSFEFDANVIGVGNLSVGGTGKSPMVEYLIKLLADNYKIATLSRGYGRKTKGFRIANDNDSASSIGDEPYQFYNKFKDIDVTVGEERAIAIPHILAELESDVILMDDAFQHRYVKPGLNIMLTDYSRPFYSDFVLPTGRLRESRDGAQRADIIVVTKCKEDITEQEMDAIEKEVSAYAPNAQVCFTSIKYLSPKPVFDNEQFSDNILLFSGIANNKPLIEHVSTHYQIMDEFYFADHHAYSTKDMNGLEERFRRMPIADKCLLTTEKDMVKLLDPALESTVHHLPIFYIPIETYFVRGGKIFDEMVLNSIKQYSE